MSRAFLFCRYDVFKKLLKGFVVPQKAIERTYRPSITDENAKAEHEITFWKTIKKHSC